MTRKQNRDRYDKMMARCYNENHPAYDKYGGRGITVFKGWHTNYQAYEDYIMSLPRRSDQHSIDRIKNNKGYVPGNLRWANHVEQNNNKSDNVTHKGEPSETAAKRLGLASGGTIQMRILSGWDKEKAFSSKRYTHKKGNRGENIKYKGETANEAAVRLGFKSAQSIFCRLWEGWTLKRAFTTPKKR